MKTTLQERQRQLREDAILDAAYEMMVQHGYTDMSMDDLAARVGISKATLYQHFPSKEELAVSVIVRSMEQGEAELDSDDPLLPAVVRLERSLRHGIERRAGLWAARMSLLPMNIKHHPRFQAKYEKMMAQMTRLVDAAKAEGSVQPDIPTFMIVRMLSSLFRTDFEECIQSGVCNAQQLSTYLVRIAFEGIRTRDQKPQPATHSKSDTP
ncbi:MAG: TetR/AcrR family transcriptional regulator [Herpetosiphon sp.]